MKYLKRLSVLSVWATVALMTVMLQMSCSKSEEKHFVFHSSEEAVATCHQTLAEFRDIKDADIEKLTGVIATWMELQDSVYNYMANDSTIQMNSHLMTDYYTVADSIRVEIHRLAQARSRSLRDVTYLMINTSHDRKNTRKSPNYKTACKLFVEMDKDVPFPDANSTVFAYNTLLDSTASFSKEGEVLDFMKAEDKCFRSLMNHLTEVNQNILASITTKTAHLFDDLYKRVSVDGEDPVSERVMLYLTMRFNRRILQNAEACRRDIKAKKVLDAQQTDNYRWMLIQPFISIDNYSMAALTEEQEKQLLELADELPSLIAYLDDTPNKPDDLKKMTDILSDFFLSSYLKSTL